MAELALETDLVISGSNLTPNDKVFAATEYVPDDGTPGFNVGSNYVVVKANGTARIVTDYEEVTGADQPKHRPGTLTVRLFKVDPVNDNPEIVSTTKRIE